MDANAISTNEKSVQNETGAEMAPADPIQNAMGHFGRWHLFVCAAMFLLKLPGAWHQMSIIFLAPPTTFQCANATIDKCSADCSEWIYDRSVFEQTIIMEWDLVCDRAQLANLSQTVFMLGILVGSMVFGSWADKYGRRSPLVAAVLIQLGSGVATSFAPWFWLFCVLRFILAMATGGSLVVSFVLLMELVGEKRRVLISILYHVPFTFGYAILPVFAYFVRDWHVLQLALSLVSIVLISYYWIIPESPRWLFTIGRVNEAAAVLEKAAKTNRLPTNTIHDQLNAYFEQRQAAAVSVARGSFTDLIRTPNMRKKTLCICFNWFACGQSYFGVAQYIGQSAGDIYTNVAVSAVIALPGTLVPLFIMPLIGRRNTLFLATLTSGVAMILVAVFPEYQVLLASVAMVGSGAAFPTTYLYSGELFPTVVRNIGIGAASMAARIGPMIAPFIISLTAVHSALPPLILGVVPFISAVLVLLLPETRGHPLPATIEDAELFGKKLPKLSPGR